MGFARAMDGFASLYSIRWKTKWLAAISLGLAVTACQKEALESSPPEVSKKQETLLHYEVYSPEDSDQEAIEFYESCLQVFHDQNGPEQTALNKAIWLMEGAMNAFFGDSLYLEEDSMIVLQQLYTLELSESETVRNADIKSSFEAEYHRIKSTLQGDPSLSFSIFDVQVSSISGAEVVLRFNTFLQVNASSVSSYAWPNVPPATVGRYAGISAECGLLTGAGAYEHVQWQTRQTLPALLYPLNFNRTHPRFNVVYFNSDAGAKGTLYFDGTWMLGHTKAIFQHHVGLIPIGTCVTPQEQDSYSQMLADNLYQFVSKRTHWDGVSNLRVKGGGQVSGSSLTAWLFDGVLSKNILLNQKLTPCNLGIDC